MRLAALLRRNSLASMEATRGPKKKKGESEAKIESTDIINIFKERADPVIKDIREYPIYVQELSYGNNTCHEHTLALMHNIESKMPYRSNYNSFLKSFKRQRTISIGKFKHQDRHPDIMSEIDPISRNEVYMPGYLSKEEQDEKKRLEEEAAAMDDDDED